MLQGVDVSGFQPNDFDFSPFDFGIVKATEGTDFTSGGFPAQAERCLSQGKLLGLYHYARPDYGNTATSESMFFLSKIKPYVGKAIIALDWEADALPYPVSWVYDWCKTVWDETGVRPFIYIQQSQEAINKWDKIKKDFPLWIAQWDVDYPTVTNWDKWTIWQYRGEPLDLDYFNGSVWDWKSWTGSNVSSEWIKGNRFLSQSEMENNARLIWKFFQAKGWTLQSVAAMLGNMETESTINPGIWENLQPWPPSSVGLRGMGLVGWTPYSRIVNWEQEHGYEFDSGPGQLEKLLEEMEHPEIEVTWIATSDYNFSFREFSQSTESPEYLADAFLKNYERPYNPNQPNRAVQARSWFNFLLGTPVFTPRLNSNNINGNPLWYSNENIFYRAQFGLPNCTCYAWGRLWEIMGTPPTTSLNGNGGEWFEQGKAAGLRYGTKPELGAVICWGPPTMGHVAIVEQINEDGSIVTSNSGYPNTFFWIETLYPPDYQVSWNPSYYFQGFLYLFNSATGPGPKPPEPPYDFGQEPMQYIYYLKNF